MWSWGLLVGAILDADIMVQRITDFSITICLFYQTGSSRRTVVLASSLD